MTTPDSVKDNYNSDVWMTAVLRSLNVPTQLIFILVNFTGLLCRVTGRIGIFGTLTGLGSIFGSYRLIEKS